MNEVKHRDQFLDVAKGISIGLVVTFHMTRSYDSAGLIRYGALLRYLDVAAYGVHVHAFFIISGFFAERAAQRGVGLRDRVATLYYPYILWSVLSFLISSVSPASHSLSAHDLYLIPVWPILHYWFLLSLLASTLALTYIRRDSILFICSIGAMLLAASMDNYPVLFPIENTLYFFLFAAIGFTLSRHYHWPQFSGIGAALGFFLLAVGACIADPKSMKFIFYLPFSLGGLYFLGWIAQFFQTKTIGTLLAYVGRRSLPIYLMHVIVGSGVRVAFSKYASGFDNRLALVISIILGIVVPLIADKLADWLGIARISGFRPLKWPSQLSAEQVARSM